MKPIHRFLLPLLLAGAGLLGFATVVQAQATPATILQRQGVLEQGDEFLEQDGSLFDVYTFTGQAGQTLSINLGSTEFDTYLLLLDPNGNMLAQNDDAFSNTLNSALIVTLPISGTYTVIVTGYNSGSRGRYSLAVYPEDGGSTDQRLTGRINQSPTSSSLASNSRSRTTWRSLQAFFQTQTPSYITEMMPESFPNGFAEGTAAFTRIHTGGSAYVVAREGVQLPGLGNVAQQGGRNILFNAVNGVDASILAFPALASFPEQLFNSSQVIEVVHWSPRYDDAELRAAARRATRATLPDRRAAYYLAQDTGRSGWCTFADESEQYSNFVCVNIANSPQTALTVLQSIARNSGNP